jgi:hypothetical protein
MLHTFLQSLHVFRMCVPLPPILWTFLCAQDVGVASLEFNDCCWKFNPWETFTACASDCALAWTFDELASDSGGVIRSPLDCCLLGSGHFIRSPLDSYPEFLDRNGSVSKLWKDLTGVKIGLIELSKSFAFEQEAFWESSQISGSGDFIRSPLDSCLSRCVKGSPLETSPSLIIENECSDAAASSSVGSHGS